MIRALLMSPGSVWNPYLTAPPIPALLCVQLRGVLDEDVQAELDKSLARAKDDKARRETREFFERSKDDIRAAIRESKVIKMIRDSAKVKTIKA